MSAYQRVSWNLAPKLERGMEAEEISVVQSPAPSSIMFFRFLSLFCNLKMYAFKSCID